MCFSYPFFGLALFLPAGSLAFWNAWLFMGIFVDLMFFFDLYLLRKDPVLLEKRLKATETEKPQRMAMLLLILAVLSTFVISGFDYKYHWSAVPTWVTVIATLVSMAGTIMFFMVMHQNSYASRVIEIQKQQKLIENGLYALIRHPMYLASCMIFCLSPFVLGSYYALLPAIFIPVSIGMRIANEEMILRKGLA
jgi:protein-S-isoprenylcysteine O-methyltransferase Ste14